MISRLNSKSQNELAPPGQEAIISPRAALTASAGTLLATPAHAGVDAKEIVDLAGAAASASIKWTSDGCAAFVWGVSNLSGLPFFDLNNRTANNNPLTPQDTSYVVPHSSNPDAGGDGWLIASKERSVSALATILKAGDVVRVYANGNSGEATFLNGKAAGHSFVVVSNKNGDVQVVDNWSGGKISQHSFSTISNSFAPSGSFGSVYVSRIDTAWVSSHVDASSVQGQGYGNWSAFVDSTAPTLVSSTPADNATKVAIDSNIMLSFSEKVTDGSGMIEIWNKNGKVESIDVDGGRVTFSGSTVTVDPKNLLAAGTDYYILIKSGAIEDLSGNDYAGISSKTALNFTTISDTIPPKLSSSNPADNATNVSVSADIVLTFNEKVTSGSGSIEIWAKGASKPFERIDVDSSRVDFSGTTVTIDPKGKLSTNTEYYLVINKGVIEDLAGNDYAGFTSSTTLNFKTSSKSSLQPEHGAGLEGVHDVNPAHPNTSDLGSFGFDDGRAGEFDFSSVATDGRPLPFADVSPGAFSEAPRELIMEARMEMTLLHGGWDLP